jgi:YD repeat-containing protein
MHEMLPRAGAPMKRRIRMRAILGSVLVSCCALAARSPAQDQTSYVYDELGRLISACDVGQSKLKTYQFDPAGNRTNFSLTSNSCGPTTFAIGDATAVAEGSSLTFTVTRSGNLAPTHAVSYATANGTATSGSDYTAIAATVLTFTAGQASKTVTIATINDRVYENNETALVNLTNPTNGATISDSQGSGTINNDDAAPSFTISNASATAGSALSFTVTKTGSTALSHSVNYATANGTAIAGTHYKAKSGTLTFTSGQTSQAVSVNTTSGSVPSGSSKGMVVNLSSATNGATIADSQGSGTINAPANNPPVAVNDSVSGSYQVWDVVPVYVRINDSDPDGDSLTVTAVSCVSSGCTASIAAGGTHITIRGSTVGNKTVNYTISDGRGGADTAQATAGYFDDSCQFC